MKRLIRSTAGIAAWCLALVAIAFLVGAAAPAHLGSAVAALASPRHLVTGGGLAVGMIINAENIDALNVAFNTAFNEAFANAPSKWAQVAMRVGSGTKTMTYAWLGQATRFREWLGDRVIQNLKAHAYSITNKRYENTVGVPVDDIKDDQYGVYTPLIQQMGYDAKTHPDELLFGLMKDAAATKCYDGQNFLDTDHPVEDADGVVQSVSNYSAGAGPVWFLADLSKPIKPFIVQVREDYAFTVLNNPTDQNVFMRNEALYGATGRLNVGLGLWQLAQGSTDVLNVANYAAAREALLNRKGDRGRVLGITPTHLIVSPTNEGAANALVKAQKDAAGADNIWFGTAQVIVAPWLE